MSSGNMWERRPTLTLWVYDSVLGAAAGQVRLDALSRRRSVETLDAVTVTWVPGAHRPRVTELHPATTRDWGLTNLVRLLTEEQSGREGLQELAGRLDGTGIDEVFLSEMRTALQPGSSALLVFAANADLDVVRAVIERGRARGDVRLLHAYLAPDAGSTLQAALVST
jgi:uncharacterized membrane protein